MPSLKRITDLTARDAHQSLFATRLRTEELVEIVTALDRVGYASLESWGGATFDVCIRFLNENPFDRLRQFKKAAPKTPHQMLLRGQNLTGYKHYPDNVVQEYIRIVAENGINVFRVFDALNDMRNIKTAIEAIKATKQEAQGTISYTTGPVFDVDYYVGKARELAEMDCDAICIKDMAGLLTVKELKAIIPSIRQAVDLPLVLHMHSGMGRSDAVLKEAVYLFDQIDLANHGMCNGSGHSNIDVVRNHVDADVRAAVADFNWDAYAEAEELAYIASINYYCAGKGSKFNPKLQGRLRRAGVPGGMLSNFEGHIRQQITGRDISYDQAQQAILDLIPEVREKLGWVPLVTPTSQIVGTQAVVTYLADVLNGEAVCSTLTENSKSLLRGEYGQLPVAADPELVSRACAEKNMDSPITCRPADLLEPFDFNAFAKSLRSRGMEAGDNEDELVLIAALWGEMGEKFALGEGWHENELPVTPPSFCIQHDFGKHRSDEAPAKGDSDLVAAVGLANIARVVDAALEIVRVREDFYEGLNQEELEQKVQKDKNIINEFYESLPDLLEKAGFWDIQSYGAVHALDRIMAKIAEIRGLAAGDIPQVPGHIKSAIG